MKKYNLFKILGLIFVGYFLLTWILPGSYYSGGLQDIGRYEMSIPSLWQMPLQVVGNFPHIFIFILTVGAFYGVLEATGVYRKALDNLTKKLKNNKLVWLLVIMFIIAALSSVAGLELGFLIIFPFIMSLIVLLGYDKFVAILATFGATIVGMFGSTYSYSAYGANNYFLGTKMADGILMKVILFVLGFALLVAFTLLHINKEEKIFKTKKGKAKDKNKKDKEVIAVKIETKDEEKFIPKASTKSKDKKTWPFIVIISVVLLIYVLATISWSDAFNISWFNNLYTKIMTFQIKEYPIISKLFNGVKEIGTLVGPTRYLHYSGILFISTIVMSLVYRLKFDEYLDAIFNGAKGYIKTACLVLFSYTILVAVTSFPVFLTIAKNIVGDSFNIATTGLATMLGSGLYIDIYYYPQYIIQYFAGLENADANILSVLFVSLYSAVMLVVPTSTLLIATLNTTETSYKDWIKFVWKLFLALIVVAFVVLTIFSLI